MLVTGSGSGIGRGIAEVLTQRGWRVVVNDVDRDAAEATAELLGTVALVADVRTDPASLIADAVQLCGGTLDGLVNNAGIIRRSALADTPATSMDEVYEVNLKVLMMLSQAAVPVLAASGGSIVNISSIVADVPQIMGGFYSMSKAGVSAFTKQAAAEWGPKGVRVNAIAPGLIRTAMAEPVYSVPELFEKRRSMIPLRRIGTPHDIGNVVAFLLSPDAAYVSGQVIAVDGAFTQTLIGLLPHPAAD